jgi:hypothetical protein
MKGEGRATVSGNLVLHNAEHGPGPEDCKRSVLLLEQERNEKLCETLFVFTADRL